MSAEVSSSSKASVRLKQLSLTQSAPEVLKELCLNEEDSHDGPLFSYKHLYHRTVLRCGQLERQIECFSRLFQKMAQVERLTEVSVNSIAENRSLLEGKRRELLEERQQWEAKLKDAETRMDDLRKEHLLRTGSLEEVVEGLRGQCGRLLASAALGEARRRLQEERQLAVEAALTEHNITVSKLKRRLAGYNRNVQRIKDLQESLEFAEAERSTLSEYITELEQQVSKLRADQQTALGESEELKLAKAVLAETCTALQQLLHNEDSQSVVGRTTASSNDTTHCSQQQADNGPDTTTTSLLARLKTLTRETEVTLTSRRPTPPQDHTVSSSESDDLKTISERPPSSCPQCVQLHGQLSTALGALNDRSSAKYGDLLRENFALTQEVAMAKKELSHGAKQFEMLTSYLHEYQSNSTKKINVLKENLSKADREIAELDKLVEHIRSVLHSNLAMVKRTPPLLALLRELDGTEAPLSY